MGKQTYFDSIGPCLIIDDMMLDLSTVCAIVWKQREKDLKIEFYQMGDDNAYTTSIMCEGEQFCKLIIRELFSLWANIKKESKTSSTQRSTTT